MLIYSGRKHLIACGIWLMVRREFLRIKMEPSRIAGMLLQPLLFLLVFGLGFHRSFLLPDHRELSYAAFFYPGILGLVVLFSSIYATLTLVDDKKCGFFRLMTISPAGLFGAVVGKVCATTILGFSQSLLFLPLVWFLPIELHTISLGATLSLLFLGAFCCSLTGVFLAWLSPSPSAFHALMSVLLIPMWLLSGAMFPIKDTIFWWPSFVNPMSHLVDGLRGSMLGISSSLPHLVALVVCSIFIGCALIVIVERRPLE